MATAHDILSIASKEIGYKETPKGSNNTKYGAWYGLNGNPWCMIFVQWIFMRASAYSLLPKRTASCTEFMNAAKSKGQFVTSGYTPGDVVLFNFSGKKTYAEHVGIVKSNEGNHLITIEGNTAINNDDNGGAVMERSRKLSVIVGAFRPSYDIPNKTPTDVAKEVMDGKWGNGDERKKRLRDAGYNPTEIQSIVNSLNSKRKSLDTIATECADGVYGNGLVRKLRLIAMGYSKSEIETIQKKINEKFM